MANAFKNAWNKIRKPRNHCIAMNLYANNNFCPERTYQNYTFQVRKWEGLVWLADEAKHEASQDCDAVGSKQNQKQLPVEGNSSRSCLRVFPLSSVPDSGRDISEVVGEAHKSEFANDTTKQHNERQENLRAELQDQQQFGCTCILPTTTVTHSLILEAEGRIM